MRPSSTCRGSRPISTALTEPGYVTDILDRLCAEHPRIYGSLLYVEQPFPYDLHQYRIDVHSVSARKPLFMDESAHDWTHVATGRELGWTGVALKTCKTQSGALLSACWAKAHGMTLMVQNLTNPMLAMLPHVQLAAHVGTIMGIEANSMQFYPKRLARKPRSIRDCIRAAAARSIFPPSADRALAIGCRRLSGSFPHRRQTIETDPPSLRTVFI